MTTRDETETTFQQEPAYRRWQYRSIGRHCPPRGMERAIQRTKTETRERRSSLKPPRQVLPTTRPGPFCSPVCCLLVTSFNHGFPTPFPPPFGFGHHASGLRDAPISFVSPVRATGHEPFGCFEGPPLPLARLSLLCGPTVRFQLRIAVGSIPWILRWIKKRRGRLSGVLSQLFGGPPGPGLVPPALSANIIRPGNNSPLFGLEISNIRCHFLPPLARSQ